MYYDGSIGPGKSHLYHRPVEPVRSSQSESTRSSLPGLSSHTPRGVHEGISCLACHPAVSSCNLDVMEMNTSYKSRESPNNIHSMECPDCHDPIPE